MSEQAAPGEARGQWAEQDSLEHVLMAFTWSQATHPQVSTIQLHPFHSCLPLLTLQTIIPIILSPRHDHKPQDKTNTYHHSQFPDH